MRNNYSLGYRVFARFNAVFLAAAALLCIAPLLNVLAISFSSKEPADAGLVAFWPIKFTLDAYAKTFDNQNFIRSFWIAVERTALATTLTMALTCTAAYALSKEDRVFRGRTAYAWIIVFTMLFSGGLIPSYLVVYHLGLTNTIASLVLPGAANVFNVVLMMNFFRGIPKELEEAALIDGAGHFRTLLRIYLPISLPSLATLGLFTIVGNWNSWFDGLIYMSDFRNYPMSTFLQTVVAATDFTKLSMDPREFSNLSDRTLKASLIFVSALPVLAVYPFLQKYFVHGMTLGSVKE
ncbi:carbohydrate ABC transporter permease [Paenibacillus sp. GCM10023250]|uniref:carbohydrate ABC transporter permease n=1 Tax=Paenibacillus sp. GCM10023250 TaxID=3252648 RepID=UPI00361E7E9B